MAKKENNNRTQLTTVQQVFEPEMVEPVLPCGHTESEHRQMLEEALLADFDPLAALQATGITIIVIG